MLSYSKVRGGRDERSIFVFKKLKFSSHLCTFIYHGVTTVIIGYLPFPNSVCHNIRLSLHCTSTQLKNGIQTSEPENEQADGLSDTGTIVPIAVGVGVAILIVTVIVVAIVMMRKNKRGAGYVGEPL